jgi:hypothetical protein
LGHVDVQKSVEQGISIPRLALVWLRG